MLMMLNLTLSMIFLTLNHPMTMGLILLLQTMIISMITGMLNMNFWFSYILFLIMVGGMLVLFIYMTSIASNEMFSYSNKTLLYLILMIMIFSSMYWIMDSYLTMTFNLYNENTQNHFLNNYNLTKFLNYPSMSMIFFMIIYLFITLIAVVKITKIEKGPLRQKF